MDDILVHDAKEPDITLHTMLAMMTGDLPVAIGVIRDVDAPVYDESVQQQLEEVKSKKTARTLNEMLMAGEVWEIR